MVFKKIIVLFMVLLLSLPSYVGCGFHGNLSQYSDVYYDVFDTVTTVIGIAASESEFQITAENIHEKLKYYHQLFDIYNDYYGINNIKTINDHAGLSAVTVDESLIHLLLDCKEYYDLTSGRVNVLMGSVLNLWHVSREDSLSNPEACYLPDIQLLEDARAYTSIDNLEIDLQASSVYLRSKNSRLDVGAVAKGWAVQQIVGELPSGYLLNVGGNVCSTGPKQTDGTPWVIGIEHPYGDGYLHKVFSSGNAVVTSGDYQRFYTVNGRRYHHIIDPDTLFPSEYWCSVSVICSDSALADVLSTALFLMPLEEGIILADACNAEALWMDSNGGLFYSNGFKDYIVK